VSSLERPRTTARLRSIRPPLQTVAVRSAVRHVQRMEVAAPTLANDQASLNNPPHGDRPANCQVCLPAT
jgi:hypothetical protein